MAATILLIEDDAYICDSLKTMLAGQGYQVVTAGDLASARELFAAGSQDLLILDVLFPDGNGLDFCSEIRKLSDVPILFLTCCDGEEDVVRGFEGGGDDYLAKPFRMKELLVRVRALLRRKAQMGTIRAGAFVMDVEKRVVTVADAPVIVTPTEFQLLYELAKHMDAVVPRERLIKAVWEQDGEYMVENTLAVHISRLRERLGSEGHRIETIRGQGYRLSTGGGE